MQFRKTTLIRTSLYSLLLCSLTFSFSCSSGSVVENNSSPTPAYTYKPPTPAPTPVDSKVNQINVRLLDGGDAKFTDLIGNNKVVLVNFWATWCAPCRHEIPELIALQRELRDKGVEVIGLTIEDPELTQEDVRAFAKKLSINYKIGFSPEEMFMIFNGQNPRAVIPQTFIFDRNGKLVDRLKGFRRDFRFWVAGAVNHALNNS